MVSAVQVWRSSNTPDCHQLACSFSWVLCGYGACTFIVSYGVPRGKNSNKPRNTNFFWNLVFQQTKEHRIPSLRESGAESSSVPEDGEGGTGCASRRRSLIRARSCPIFRCATWRRISARRRPTAHSQRARWTRRRERSWRFCALVGSV
jgi:hypothetical protein